MLPKLSHLPIWHCPKEFMTTPAAPSAIPPRPLLQEAPAAALAAADGGICVVGIGASAGGLEAAKKFLAALPAASGLAYILVQHMDPTHESMMVELLSEVSAVPVIQASDGMVLAIDRLYVIPPGLYLSLNAGILRLSAPQARHGTRLPFDFLLQSLAASVGPRAVCVVLSGSGADGTLGSQKIKAAGGLVMVQAPNEAGNDGMPRNAIATGQVDFVLPVEEIAKKLANYRQHLPPPKAEQAVARIVALLHERTPHDFTLYKPGTLQRRIDRRMAIAGVAPADTERYLAILQGDQAECDLLAEDMLINVTGFFRDPKAFEMLAEQVVPGIVTEAMDRPLRIWIAGCSTGEETYSLAILFLEQFSLVKSTAKLQIFASDVDESAVKTARDGLYPATIEANVSPQRLARFFTRDDHGYRISAAVREHIVFAVQDVLADPPFSKLDFISCRNLLIYLRPEAQAKIISIFHFALRKNGFLLLGSAETVGAADARFAVISKAGRLYRKTSAGGLGTMPVSTKGETARAMTRTEPPRVTPRGPDVAELCKRLVLAAYAPATILINARRECLYSSGPTEIYLRVAPGYPTHDLLAMIRPVLRARVKAAIAQADSKNTRIVVAGGRVTREGRNLSFNIDVRPVVNDGERLFLVCFVDQPKPDRTARQEVSPHELPRITELEQELAATRLELQTALHSLDAAAQEQNAVNEEALSVNEEYQSTNEELVTSKEELQSLNEELTALNSQLQETLERSRTTSNDLQNVLYSTDVATLFLDSQLNIRFFTPPTKALFTLRPGDVGRPLAELHSLSADTELTADAEKVLHDFLPIERQLQTSNGMWFSRRILPYRTHDAAVAGVVITFIDITERKMVSAKLEESQRVSERANIAKTRFLAAASHDLRQPLQTLTLLNSLLAKVATEAPAQRLLAKLDDTTTAMTGILNTLLDINQIDAGIVRVEMEPFAISDLLGKLAGEFSDLAVSRGLELRAAASSLIILTDPRILEQMLRNLLSNALKYTIKGGILLGCRRRGQTVEIQVWDTGLGIPDAEINSIFEEYHQVDNAARERSRGLGLGLSIVQRLSALLNHRVSVHSVHGKGSVFTIETRLCATQSATIPASLALTVKPNLAQASAKIGKILIIEDDPDIRQLLEMSLTEERHRVVTARDCPSAVGLVAAQKFRPNIIIADYNLPNGGTGLETVQKLRVMIGQTVPVIMVTGDTSTGTMRAIASAGCFQLNKPMKLKELNDTIQHLLAAPAQGSAPTPSRNGDSDGLATVYVIDDDPTICDAIRNLLEAASYHVSTFNDGEAFLSGGAKASNACLLLDANLPGMSGFDVLKSLSKQKIHLPTIMFTGKGDINLAVEAMKAGAFDFVEKPVGGDKLLASVSRALAQAKDAENAQLHRQRAVTQIASLTSRQRQIMDLVLAGTASKNIAADLGISQRTVEKHRAAIMEKTGTKSTPALARLAILGSETTDAPAD
jgi:two-component system, chemotaxis family, CheB/CheR fusion protein